ncbi:aryl-alcohol dehydrogenase-like predicted oxidoreductase [Isoptericola sp. CG 20/1183]|uniref:Aryl-alcohol dehydrogenase-like predicted oxidoreductase n=1 Tax=Isoptericola halotolerans TaxID=300560 RepID=A0ABX5EI86_9MICO|nr:MULTISPECIES: aldo/keto reductase [Isoptericola]PRZ08216.1 aryl-alcohol dehydrogenase-like predicted oxidoreductase [Isoptericola halotolerans]PRZ09013.1 aryl-alcohol dehydrogenase-like predicted oxidoreductase [Isoptericola sp. CG 20/1183]
MRYRTIGTGDRAIEVSMLCLGTMNYGTLVDPATSEAILDRFVEAGGTFLDTANNYAIWNGGHGRDSEDLIGGWLASRGVRDQVRIATKVGAGPRDPAAPFGPENFEGLGAEVIEAQAHESLRHLGTDRIDVLYGHVDDRATPLAETVGALGKLQAERSVGLTGISNVALWRLVEARAEAERQGVPPYAVVQQQHSYVYPRPTSRPWVTRDLLDYAASTGAPGRPALTVVGYGPLQAGALMREDKGLYHDADHPGSVHRVSVLREVAREIGATPAQVALSWMMGGEVPVVPVTGPSSVEQLDELLGAVHLDLPAEVRARLDAA